ncbi:thioredoxin TrxC [Veronia pacifica]|uniref:Thioredoxin n=1 Tax=Veronia pacifica TaxID=1080227 RepID=A0A1C3E9K6_9GAMM|nr:thioredoxin TrxC [Veronia pacifica]ODA29922.1 thioredoxin [Veronia pacifica]
MIICCPDCSGLNRVPDERLYQAPNCGRCKSALFKGKPIDLNSSNFDRHATKADLPLVVDFWANWCGPCQSFAPIFSQAAEQLEPKFRFGKINTETEQTLAARFSIRSIPTLMVFKQGKLIGQQAGALPKEAFHQWLSQFN